ncbi:hypothetical protein [Pelomonas sp. KK5]|uniref:hypothetical protein n=1 Tax=Pelomonas sp. KK5 TaxID=1855730 RepID=UPI00097BDB80|nr:hypothetical protein [Pelomonas sp. KK5]
MSAIASSPRFLPRLMWADAASCAATGALQLAFTGALAGLTGLPAPLLAGTGLFLLAYAAAAAGMALQRVPPRRLIGLVVIGNFGWALACLALLLGGGLPLSGLGVAWVLAQLACVLVLGELQWMGLKRSRQAGRAAPLAA